MLTKSSKPYRARLPGSNRFSIEYSPKDSPEPSHGTPHVPRVPSLLLSQRRAQKPQIVHSPAGAPRVKLQSQFLNGCPARALAGDSILARIPSRARQGPVSAHAGSIHSLYILHNR